jgi:anthranilate phosphoribosyltransferase
MDIQSWPSILGSLLAGEDLQRQQAEWALRQMMSGDASEGQIGAFMMALRSKGETVEELAGLVDVMLDNAVVLDTGKDAVDIVGTGGDLVGTVNISSMASIVAAASEVPVLKHGSRSASGKTGSSEMLEVLGIRLDLAPLQVAEAFRKVGITFFFAPVFHPAMRYVAPVRKQLGVPTTLNFLGPLANPAQPIATALGVANQSIAPVMAQEMAARGRTALVFRSDDGLDELSTTAINRVLQVHNGQVTAFELDARDFGMQRVEQSALLGGDPQHNAKVASRLFAGEQFENSAAIKDVVVLNAAGGIVAYEIAKGSTLEIQDLFDQAIARASSAIDSGAAAQKLVQWSAVTQQL